MNQKHRIKITRLILVAAVAFLVIAGSGIIMCSRYISNQLLHANENTAIDIALLAKNNFQITDAEVAYMKTLTFNQMEVDPINLRLMAVGDGVELNNNVINVYLIAPLAPEEIKYITDEETAAFFDCEPGTPLDGIWLLNGNIDENGKFVPTQREDIYRYTVLTDNHKLAIAQGSTIGEYSGDSWGNFITGYAPVYTVEGNFVGLIGIDMDPDRFQTSAKSLMFVLLAAFVTVSIVMLVLFFYIYIKYIRVKEGQLHFDFYSRMSHDMRTPMNGILGMAALSKDEQDVNVLHHNFAQVEEAGKYMLGLINDTLDVQKLDAGKLKLDPKLRNCEELVRGLVDMIRPEAEKKNIAFVLDSQVNLDCYSYIDALRIQQIFMNIASNAIKFTPEGGTVRLHIDCLGMEGEIAHMKLQLSDTGIGMSREFIHDHLFRPFEQEQNSVTTQYGGSGLGLSIVKNLIELMNGHIEVESTPGVGSTFTVYLDFRLIDREIAIKKLQEEETPAAATSLQGRHILVCEDHPLNAHIAVKLLEKVGCRVSVAENGKEGVAAFARSCVGEYDAILMDIRMPVMDGLAATHAIRTMGRGDAKEIPIIAMTANAYAEDVQRCLSAGMNAHLVKPINPEKLYQTIETYLYLKE